MLVKSYGSEIQVILILLLLVKVLFNKELF